MDFGGRVGRKKGRAAGAGGPSLGRKRPVWGDSDVSRRMQLNKWSLEKPFIRMLKAWARDIFVAVLGTFRDGGAAGWLKSQS